MSTKVKVWRVHDRHTGENVTVTNERLSWRQLHQLYPNPRWDWQWAKVNGLMPKAQSLR